MSGIKRTINVNGGSLGVARLGEPFVFYSSVDYFCSR